MGIKLVKNFEEGRYSVLNSNFLLQIIDNNKQLECFSGKSFYVFNPLTNERFEIMPELAKYDFAKYMYTGKDRNYTIFTSAKQVNEQDVEIQFYKYNIDDGSSVLFYTRVVNLASINESFFIKIFGLPEGYCLIEFIDILKLDGKYELVLKNYNSKKELKITNKILSDYGLDKIIPLSGNQCAIKIGDEIIGVININRFISDMVIGLENVYIDILDQGNGQFELPFMRRYSDNLTYLKQDKETGNEEIVIYDYENKVKKVRFNSNVNENSDLKKLHVINKTPYYFVDMEDGVSIVNLNTQKAEAELYDNLYVKYVVGDLIVACRHIYKKFLIGREKDHVEVYRFPDTKHPIYKVNGQFSCCVQHFDDLLIFIS